MAGRERAGRRVGWTIVAVVLVASALLALLPALLAPYLSIRLSAAAGVPVHVGWVTVNPFISRIVLHRLTLALARDTPPVLTMRVLAADVALRRLLDGDLVLTQLIVRDPWLALRRTASGDIDLGAGLAAPAVPNAGAGQAPVRSIVVERLRMTGGSVEFHDETTTPSLATSLQLEDVTADDLEIVSSSRTHIQLDLASRLEQAPVRLALAYAAEGEDSRLTIALKTTGVSLARTLVHVPLGWREASGVLDADLTYRREVVAGRLRSHALAGHAEARDLAFTDPGAAEPRVRATRARLGHLDVDLMQRRTTLRAIKLEGFQAVVAREAAGLHVPFMTPGGGTDTAWTTIVGDVTFATGDVILRAVIPGADPELHLAVRNGSLRTERDGGLHLLLHTTMGAGGIDLDGRFDDRGNRWLLGARAVSLPELADRLRWPLRFATGTVDGTVEADLAAAGGPSLSGSLRVAGGRTLPVDPAAATDVLAWQDLSVDLEAVRLAPLRVHVRRLDATWPYAMIHRAASGVFPMTLVSGGRDGEAPAPEQTGHGDFIVDELALHHARLEFYDTTLQPPYWSELTDTELAATTLTYPPFTTTHLGLDGAVDELSPLHATAAIDSRGSRVDLTVEQLRLPPFSPYLEPGLQYAVTSGSARIVSRLTLTGPRLDAANDVVLSRFGLTRTGEDAFQRELGAPLSVALALMKDYRGDITLPLPVRGDVGTGEFEVRNLFATALSEALIGAVRSPLTLLGSVFRHDEQEHFDLKPIPFAPGSAELAADGEARISEVAQLLARHETLDAVLVPDPSPADATALAVASGSNDPPADRLAALAAARLRRVVDRFIGAHHLPAARVVQRAWTPGPPQAETLPGVDVQLRGR